MRLNLTEAIRSSVLTAPNNSWPTFDGGNLTRSDFLSASEASKCVRSLAFQKHKENSTVRVENFWESMTPEQFQLAVDEVVPGKSPLGYFARGHHIESWIVSQLLAVEQDDEFFLYTDQDQRSFYHLKDKISGTPDGLYINTTTDEMWLLEFKSSQVPITQPRHAHLTQVQLNMGLFQALRKTHDMDEIVGMKLPESFSGAKLLYIDSGNYIDLQEFDIPFDGGLLYAKTKAKAAALFKGGEVAEPATLKPSGLSNNGCYFCEFKMQCKAIEDEKKNTATSKQLRALIDKKVGNVKVMPTFAADTPREEVVKLLAEYDGFSQEEKLAKKQKDALKEAISIWIKTQDDTKAEFEDDGRLIKVNLSHTVRSGGFDKDKIVKLIEETQSNMDEFVKPDTEYDTLRVTVKNVKG